MSGAIKAVGKEAPRAANCLPLPLLRGQTALVTGGSSGIGRAVSIALGEAGANVVVNYRSSREDAEDTARMVNASDVEHAGRAVAARADVSKEEDVDRLFREARDVFGCIDVLVANSGIQKDAPIREMTPDDWRKVIDVNLTGVFLCGRAAMACFEEQGIRPDVSAAAGKIICMSSMHETIPWAGRANYAASKGGVSMLMQTMAQEFARSHIRVNGIAPGAIKTPINRGAWETEDAERTLLRQIPYDRVGEPEDIGRAAAWLASDYADYVTGATLFVDGGMSLYPSFEDGSS